MQFSNFHLPNKPYYANSTCVYSLASKSVVSWLKKNHEDSVKNRQKIAGLKPFVWSGIRSSTNPKVRTKDRENSANGIDTLKKVWGDWTSEDKNQLANLFLL